MRVIIFFKVNNIERRIVKKKNGQFEYQGRIFKEWVCYGLYNEPLRCCMKRFIEQHRIARGINARIQR